MLQSHVVKICTIKITPRQILDLNKKYLANNSFREMLICFFLRVTVIFKKSHFCSDGELVFF